MGRLEGLPTVTTLYRDEIGASQFILADLKARVKSFRERYKHPEGIDPERLLLPDSHEIKKMAVTFLDEGIAEDPTTGQKEIPAGRDLLIQAKGSLLAFHDDREKTLRGFTRLFAKQNRYKIRNDTSRREHSREESGSAVPSVVEPDLPDVDEILRGKRPTQNLEREDTVPQTRSGRPYNNDLPALDANPNRNNLLPAPLTAPIATMTKDSKWGCFATIGIDSKPPIDQASNNTLGDATHMSTVTGRHNLSNTERHPYAISENETSNNVMPLNHNLNTSIPLNNSPEHDIGDANDGLLQQLGFELDPQDQPVNSDTPRSKIVKLKPGPSKKRMHPEPIDLTEHPVTVLEAGMTEKESSEYTTSAIRKRVAKKRKVKTTPDSANRANKMDKTHTQANDKSGTLTVEKSVSPHVSNAAASSPATSTAQPCTGEYSHARAVDGHSDKDHTNPLLTSRMPPPKKIRTQGRPRSTRSIRAQNLPPILDEAIIKKSKIHEPSALTEHVYVTMATDMQGSTSEIPTVEIKEPLDVLQGREMSQTIEPDPAVERVMLETSPSQYNEGPTSTRRPPIAVQFWILETRVPKVWAQWLDTTLSEQSVATMFQAVSERSRIHGFDTAIVRFQTDEQTKPYRIRKNDPDEFERVKQSIAKDSKLAMEKNRNNNSDFNLYIEPIGVERTFTGEDEMISGL